MKSFLLLSVVFCLLFGCNLFAGTIYVYSDGDIRDGHRHIQAGIDAAENGDTVIVADGVYRENNISFYGKGITVRSENGAGSCIVDCRGLGRGFRFNSGEGAGSVLDGFTIINGEALNGGGIRIANSSSPVIQNCIIRSCQSSTDGGGIYIGGGCSPLIKNCVIKGNTAEDSGGGIYFGSDDRFEVSVTVEGCHVSGNIAEGGSGGGLYGDGVFSVSVTGSSFVNNTASSGGGGIGVFQSSDVNISGCSFGGNKSLSGSGGGVRANALTTNISNSLFKDNVCASYGGGARINGGLEGIASEVMNCTFADNIASEGGGGVSVDNGLIVNSIFVDNIDNGIGGAAVIRHCAFNLEGEINGYDYTADYVSDVNGRVGCYGNIVADAMFTDALRLLPGSVCIDAGDNSEVAFYDTDLDGMARTVNDVVDIGAYEYTGVSRLLVEEDSFNVRAYEGQTEAVSLEVLLGSDYPIDDVGWEVSSKDDLIEVDKMGGTVPAGGSDKLLLSVDVSGLSLGIHSFGLSISQVGGVEVVHEISVFIWVGRVLHVPQDYEMILYAVNEAEDGDTVVVADGVYRENNISLLGKAITVRSENGPGSCIVDCQKQGRGFRFVSGEKRDSILDGFTIMNGDAPEGGGIRIYNDSSPLIQNCVIVNCESDSNGGGIYVGGDCSPLIKNCVIIDNTAYDDGGGIYCDSEGGSHASVTIEGCQVSGNRAGDYSSGQGGGLYAVGLGNVIISGSWFVDNTCLWGGGGIRTFNCDKVEISGCRFIGNESTSGGGGGVRVNSLRTEISNSIFRDNVCDDLGGGARTNGGMSEILNCTFIGNTADNAGGGASVLDGLVVNSIFVDNINNGIEGYAEIRHCAFKTTEGHYNRGGTIYAASEINELDGCYGNINPDARLTADGHLHAESLYIDAGDPTMYYSGMMDIDGEMRVYGGAADIGADEFIDSDGDEMGDWWELKFFDTLEDCAADDDADNDGSDNLDEYVKSSNPLGPYYVAVSGRDEWDGLAAYWDGNHGPKGTIQAGIDMCGNGDEVELADGTYSGYGNWDVTFRGKAITVRSANGPYNCIIDCYEPNHDSGVELHRGFVFVDGEGADSVLKGVTITNGNVGIYGNIPSDDEIEYGGYGGGIYCQYSGPTIDGCVIKNCRAFIGSAIASRNEGYWEREDVDAKSPIIKSCVIAGNTSKGSTLWFEAASGTVIDNCTITENYSLYGYGDYDSVVLFYGSYFREDQEDVIIRNSIIYNNIFDEERNGYQIDISGEEMSLQVENCDLEDGMNGIYANYGATVEWGEGNIDIDPRFVQAGYWSGNDVWSEGDYHLSSVSRCINGGAADGDYAGQTDIDGDDRLMSTRVDIGADEVVIYDGPYLSVQPSELIINIYQGEAESAGKELEISNIGIGQLDWEIADDCPWLNVDRLSGTTTGSEIETVGLNAVGGGLSAGSYSYQLVVSAPAAQNAQQVVEVVLKVHDPLVVPDEYETIQSAVDAADDGDMVLVKDGIYTSDGDVNTDFKGKAIIVRSENGAENCIVDCQGQEDGRGFRFISGEGRDSVLDGFTIINGIHFRGAGIRVDNGSGPVIQNCIITNCSADEGGGIYVGSGSRPLIKNCIITDNSAVYDGGGVYCQNDEELYTSITIEGGEISGNRSLSGDGGGIFCYSVFELSIKDCKIIDNIASEAGGGIYCAGYDGSPGYNANVTLDGCEISHNTSSSGGGGVRTYQSDKVNISGCRFIDNESINGNGGGVRVNALETRISNSIFGENGCAGAGGGARINGGTFSEVSNCTFVGNRAGLNGGGISVDNDGVIVNSIFAGNDSYEVSGAAVVSYCAFSDDDYLYYGSLGEGNIVGDPLFVDAGNGDYHLKSEGWRWDDGRGQWTWDTITSLCIDAGNPGSSFGAEVMTVDVDPQNQFGENIRVNLGAYGGTAEASMSPHGWAILSDINNDGACDVSDLTVFAGYWLGSGEAIPGDFNRDEAVNLGDFALLAYDWTN